VSVPTEVELLEIQLRAVLGDIAAEQLVAKLRREHLGGRALADAMLAVLQGLAR
jgi:hypothetical protein